MLRLIATKNKIFITCLSLLVILCLYTTWIAPYKEKKKVGLPRKSKVKKDIPQDLKHIFSFQPREQKLNERSAQILSNLRNECPLRHSDKNEVVDIYPYNWLMDTKRKLTYCIPPKTGCSSIFYIYKSIIDNDEKWLSKKYRTGQIYKIAQ